MSFLGALLPLWCSNDRRRNVLLCLYASDPSLRDLSAYGTLALAKGHALVCVEKNFDVLVALTSLVVTRVVHRSSARFNALQTFSLSRHPF